MHFDMYLSEARSPDGAFKRQQTAETGLTQWHNNDHYRRQKQTNLLITTCCSFLTSRSDGLKPQTSNRQMSYPQSGAQLRGSEVKKKLTRKHNLTNTQPQGRCDFAGASSA